MTSRDVVFDESVVLARPPTPFSIYDDEYIVEAIIDERLDKQDDHHYLVKWLGYEDADNTWEPHEYVADTEALLKWEEVILRRKSDALVVVERQTSSTDVRVDFNCCVDDDNSPAETTEMRDAIGIPVALLDDEPNMYVESESITRNVIGVPRNAIGIHDAILDFSDEPSTYAEAITRPNADK